MNNIERIIAMTEELNELSNTIDEMSPEQLSGLSEELVQFQERLSEFCSTVACSIECNTTISQDRKVELVSALEEGSKRVRSKISNLGM